MKHITEEQAILYTLKVYNLMIHFKLNNKHELFKIHPDLVKGFKYNCSYCEYGLQYKKVYDFLYHDNSRTICDFCPLVNRRHTTCRFLLSYEALFDESFKALEDLYYG